MNEATGLLIVCVLIIILVHHGCTVGKLRRDGMTYDSVNDVVIPERGDYIGICPKCGLNGAKLGCSNCGACKSCPAESRCGCCQEFGRQIDPNDRKISCPICISKKCICPTMTGRPVLSEPGASRNVVISDPMVTMHYL